MHVVWLAFHDHSRDGSPDDPWDCEMRATADIGGEKGSASFHIHICTPSSIARLPDRKHCFLIEEYLGPDPLIERLNKFVAEKTDYFRGDPYWELA